ncbi:LPXTG cell wall anchor domain-containing protein [Roseburia sp. BX1005]|uniref:LPXTG cell wall anchor domain-containing protein n=1 Tax=Roseburia zhanii TaxID=2763064 RepID=A0A923LNZ3_9FIRM|nr:LPXTG cell wall anchor domain-containing protein [Roseburia zhanii]MBC5713449.1 LPXTG cell wall anchor domain-containing protein [Roseburia zhanii]
MKKTMAIILGVIGLVLAGFSAVLKWKKQMSVSIIGGADGPTSIFLAGKIGNDFSVAGIVVGILLLVIAGLLMLRKKK